MQPARASDTKVLWVCRFAVSLQSERQSFKEIISQTECSWGWALEWENLRRHPRHWEDYSRWIECGSGMTILHDAIVLWYISELRVQPKHPSDIFKPRDGGTVKTGGFCVWSTFYWKTRICGEITTLKDRSKDRHGICNRNHVTSATFFWFCALRLERLSLYTVQWNSVGRIVPSNCCQMYRDAWQEMVAGQGKQLMLQALREDPWFSLECLRTWHGAELLTWNSTTSKPWIAPGPSLCIIDLSILSIHVSGRWTARCPSTATGGNSNFGCAKSSQILCRSGKRTMLDTRSSEPVCIIIAFCYTIHLPLTMFDFSWFCLTSTRRCEKRLWKASHNWQVSRQLFQWTRKNVRVESRIALQCFAFICKLIIAYIAYLSPIFSKSLHAGWIADDSAWAVPICGRCDGVEWWQSDAEFFST